tara:strand:- start:416 stop:868 length:453 start_codon:yes stop_codon:yes gene_type:complete
MNEEGDRKKGMLITAVMVMGIGIMGLIMITFLENHVFVSSFGKANRLKYGLMLLAAVAVVVGGYFLLKKPEGKETCTEICKTKPNALQESCQKKCIEHSCSVCHWPKYCKMNHGECKEPPNIQKQKWSLRRRGTRGSEPFLVRPHAKSHA